MSNASQGTRTRPAMIVGVNRPLFQGNGTSSWLRLLGSYLIVDGLVVDGGRVEAAGTGTVLKNSEVRNMNSTAVAISGSGTVIYKNHIITTATPKTRSSAIRMASTSCPRPSPPT